MNICISVCEYLEALTIIRNVVKDLKKLDEKSNLKGLYVYESKVYYNIKKFSEAKSRLASARA